MKKIGIATIASLAINVILSLWLVNQYFYDQYFHAYVDAALGPVYPFIILTAGLGGGSSLGYLLLRRRHAGDETGRIEKTKLFKSGGPVQPSASSQGKILPTGPPPGQVSRHTAYAVPPLPKSSTSSGGSRGATPSSISAASRPASSLEPSTFQRLEQLTQPSTSTLNSTLRDQFRPDSIPRSSPGIPPTVSRGESPPPVNRIPPDTSKTGFPQQWKPEPSPTPARPFDSNVFPRPGQMDVKSGGESSPFGSPLGQAPKPPQASQTPFPVSKWSPPDQKGETQWTDPVPKPGLAAPQKWAPPPGQGFGSRPPQGGAPRQGAPGPVPASGQRPPYPSGQAPPPPRPLGFPAPLRPGQPGPIGVPPPYRSDQPRPPGAPPQGRPIPGPGGQLPPPWSPQKSLNKPEQELSQNKDFGSPSPRPPQFGPSENPRPSAEKTQEPSSSGGEMDWDTALDTILKTLKKDRGVGEKE